MLATAAVLAGVFGLLVGSFLNVVIVRVPEGRSVVRPRSACACGTQIAARDNVPVVSWLLLRGRARCCGAPISPVYPAVELATALAFVAVILWNGLTWLLPALLYLAAISIALTVIDVRLKRLPDRIVLPSYVVVGALLVLPAAVQGEWDALLRAALGGAASYVFYGLLWLVYPAGMGFGDVKLSGVLGAVLGWLGWSEVVVGIFLGFVLGGVLGIVLMLAGRAGRKSAIPFGPYMLLGAWLSIACGGAIGDWYLGVSGF